jgi:hypothetical protein
MSKILTNKISNMMTELFINSISSSTNSVYYITANKHTAYASGDDNVPTPVDSVNETYLNYEKELIFGKKISSSDAVKVIARNDWVANTRYDAYDQDDSTLFTNRNFYVGALNGAEYCIYKVLDNNGGALSTVKPTSTSESAINFSTSDSYKYKLMYKITSDQMAKFATDDFIPVYTSSNVVANNVAFDASGAIDNIKVISRGSNYVATLDGQFNADDIRNLIPTIIGDSTTYRLNAQAASNTNFYTGSAIYIKSGTGAGQIKTITSYDAATRVIRVDSAFETAPSTDSEYIIAPRVVVRGDAASNTLAYANVSSNSSVTGYVNDIQIISRGTGYTYADAVVVGNTGGVTNTAVLKVVIPPYLGHGSTPSLELGCKTACISVTFANTESGFVSTDNDFRQFSLLRDPLFSSATFTIANTSGTFTSGETINQVDYKILAGTITSNTSNSTIIGTGTDFTHALSVGDKVIIVDSTETTRYLTTVQNVTNATHITISSNTPFNTSLGTIAHASILATAVKSGNSFPYLTANNVQPKFVIGKRLIGSSSGAWGNVTAIDVQDKNYNSWNTFDNRTRIAYTANSGMFANDAVVYQEDISLSNAYYHSANSSYIFLTSDKGPINANPATPLVEEGGGASYTLGSVKYIPDIQTGSGQVLYIENSSPIPRSNTQSETVKLMLNF